LPSRLGRCHAHLRTIYSSMLKSNGLVCRVPDTENNTLAFTKLISYLLNFKRSISINKHDDTLSNVRIIFRLMCTCATNKVRVDTRCNCNTTDLFTIQTVLLCCLFTNQSIFKLLVFLLSAIYAFTLKK
jgi:hypothetical protein